MMATTPPPTPAEFMAAQGGIRPLTPAECRSKTRALCLAMQRNNISTFTIRKAGDEFTVNMK